MLAIYQNTVLRQSQSPTLSRTQDGWLGRWYVCMLHRRSSCSLVRTIHGRIMRCGILSSCRSAITYETVKSFKSRVVYLWLFLDFSMKNVVDR